MDVFEQLRQGWISGSPEETERIGALLSAGLPQNTAIALSGDLGSGKTTFVRGLARGLGITATVTSPTYNIYTTYQGRLQLLHMDAYRLHDAHELDSLTIDEFLKPPYLIAVEWPENIHGFFEDYPSVWIRFEVLPDHRHSIRMVR